jgi:tetratricopeptide (TPR) repeat protein
MQKLYTILFFAAAIFMVYFGTKAFTAPQDEKITAFAASLQDETNGNYKEAINKLTKIYENNKDHYLMNLRLGWLNYLNGSYDQSKKFYRNAVRLTSEKTIEPFLGLTLPLAALEEWDEVRNTYTRILKIDPNFYTANLRLGQIYIENKDYANAKTHLDKAYEVYPSEFEVNLSLGWTHYYLGNKQRAKDLFITALMLNSNNDLAKQGYNLVK